MWVELIHAQMQKHRWTKAEGYDVSASRGFESLKDVPFTAIDKQAARDLREPPEPLHDIPKMLFTGFSRCLYPIQKFGSDPERRFAILLEDEKKDLKWFKPARDQFRIYYRGDQTYEPDFVVETETDKLLCSPSGPAICMMKTSRRRRKQRSNGAGMPLITSSPTAASRGPMR
jgi:type III restriction enzyme